MIDQRLYSITSNPEVIPRGRPQKRHPQHLDLCLYTAPQRIYATKTDCGEVVKDDSFIGRTKTDKGTFSISACWLEQERGNT